MMAFEMGLQLWKHGFGKADCFPLRRIQALIRARGADVVTIEVILAEIRSTLCDQSSSPPSSD